MTTPAWATALVARVCAEQGFPEPELRWRRWRNGHVYGGRSSGWTFPTFPGLRISVTAGAHRRDQRLVVLHELAHCQVGIKHSHDATFWHAAWALYEQYRGPSLSLRYILENESHYKRRALTVAADRGIFGARAALARARK